MSGRWAGSTRRSRLPGNWSKLRERILDRDGRSCQWVLHGEYIAGLWVTRRCGAYANQVDHIIRHGGDGDENLTSLCEAHHKAKTQAEAQAARRSKPRARRPSEAHPGLIEAITR